jgi:hypothetical protein
LHSGEGVCVDPVHWELPQELPCWFLQLPLPLHTPGSAHPPEPADGHSWSGSLASGTFAQMPLATPVLGWEHALHSVLHALSQHTSSTQKPDPQLEPEEQGCPFGTSAHVPFG